MIGGRYAPWPCWSGFVPVVPGTGVPGDSPVWTRSHLELSHADHWAARLRAVALRLSLREGQRVPGRLDCQPRPTLPAVASGSGYERLSTSQSPQGADADFPPAVRWTASFEPPR